MPDPTAAQYGQGLLLVIGMGTIPAFIARSKGRDFFDWWFYGIVLFIVALLHSLFMKPDLQMIAIEKLWSGRYRKCPFCAEVIKVEARACRGCSRDLTVG